jgi:hypothetical protein
MAAQFGVQNHSSLYEDGMAPMIIVMKLKLTH